MTNVLFYSSFLCLSSCTWCAEYNAAMTWDTQVTINIRCWLLFTGPTKASSKWFDNKIKIKTAILKLSFYRGQHKLNKVAHVLSRSLYFSLHGQLDETDKFTASSNGSRSLPKMTNGKEKISGWSDGPQMARHDS